MAPLYATTNLTGLLERMTNADKDFRFMATNDLMGELQRENLSWDDDNETKVTRQVLSLLQDKNGEVQNLAVKCLGFLVSKIKDTRRQIVIESLCHMLKHKSEQIRDIASIALKAIVSDMPINQNIILMMNDVLCPNLLTAISHNADVNVQLESLEILTELIDRIGSQLDSRHEVIRNELMLQLDSERSAVRKRSMNALSHLMACCSDDLFVTTVAQLIESLHGLAPSTNPENDVDFLSSTQKCTSSKTLLQCLAIIIRSAGHRSTPEQLSCVMPVIEIFCCVKDDELREYSIQVFEAYVRRCSIDTSKIVEICLLNLAHDPNYNYDDDDSLVDDDTMDMDHENEDEVESAEDYSDDDDLSWKVRRASAKCLDAVVTTRRDLIDELFVSMAHSLVSRFKEREESVKSDVILTFISLLKQIRSSMSESHSAPVRLNEMIPNIVARSTALMRDKSVKIRQVVFRMFIEIVNIIPNALAAHIAPIVSGVLFSLTDKNATSNMKIDSMVFINELIKTHDPTIFFPLVNTVAPAIVDAVGDAFYKISAEALSLLTRLVCVIRPSIDLIMPNYEPVLSMIFSKTLDRMSKTDLDLEIKEKAIICMGQTIATFGDKIPEELPVALDLLHDRLGNEAARLTCVKALIKIANSKLPLSLKCIFPRAFSTLATFLRKNSRSLRVSTLILIENVVNRSVDLLDDESVIMAQVPSLINESDLYVSQLALTMLTTIIKNRGVFHPVVSQQVFPEALGLVRSPLLQGAPLQATLKFFTTLAQSSFPSLDPYALFQRLVEPIYAGHQIHKQAYNSTAKAIAAISTHNASIALMIIQRLLEDSKRFLDNDSVYTLILLSIGEIGKVSDLSQVPNLKHVLLQAFESSSEDVKSAGSYALGCVAVGSMDVFLPVILEEIEAREKRQYLILHSLREVISAGRLQESELVWKLLMKHCECQEEGTRNVVSECLGKLVLLKPDVLLKRLIVHLKNDYAGKPLARSTIVAAVKFTISDQPQEIDSILRECIGEFLSSLQDEDITVRRVALITLNSAAHNKPSLITNLLPSILHLLYKETQVKPELIREVEMGPFKHEVDDGLDSRKAAYECMYTLLDTCQSQLDIMEFLTYVESGLKDHYDIKMLTYLMLTKLTSLCPSAVLQRMDRLILPIEEVCRARTKDNAVKQEHEKQDELKRSALRAFDSLRSIPNADKHPVLVRFYDNVIVGVKEVEAIYNSMLKQHEAINSGATSVDNGVYRMDTS